MLDWYYILICVIAALFVTILIVTRIYLKHWSIGKYQIKQDLTGKVVIVTGGSAGIGKETTRELAKHGATVYIASRNVEKAKQAAVEIEASKGFSGKLFVVPLDLACFQSIENFVKDFLKRESRLDILINNAGIAAVGRGNSPTLTVDGIEETMQTNHFGQFLLTNRLLDLLKKSAPSRIVVVSSYLHSFAKFDVENEKTHFQAASSDGFSQYNAYNCSKLCNILFTRSLARRLHGTGVAVNSLHPGVVATELGRDIKCYCLVKLAMAVGTTLFWKTPREGAQTSLYCALAPELEHVSGVYFSDCRPCLSSLESHDEQIFEKLWAVSAKLTGTF